MTTFHPKKVRSLLRHFKEFKQAQSGIPMNEPIAKKEAIIPQTPTQHPKEVYDDIKSFKDAIMPQFPKIIVETKEKSVLARINEKISEASDELSENERRLYDLFSELSQIKEESKEHEEKEEELNEEQSEKIKELEDELRELQLNRPEPIQYEVKMPKIEAPIMARDKKVNSIQNSLYVMQEKLNQLIEIKIEDDKEKMKDYHEKLAGTDKAIKQFEMKLIKLQGKHTQKQLKPLIDKINELKKRYNDLAIKIGSKSGKDISPLKLTDITEMPEEAAVSPEIRQAKAMIQKQRRIIPTSLELPDITQEVPEIRIDLPEPVPDVPVIPKKEVRKPGFFNYLGKEVKKFIHV